MILYFSYFLRTMLSEAYIKEFLMESIDHGIFWPYRSTQVFKTLRLAVE